MPFVKSNGKLSSPIEDEKVNKHYKALIRECRAGACEDSMRQLLAFIWPTSGFKVAKNCDFISLGYYGFEGRYPSVDPPCFRDKIINSAATILQSVLQGFIILGF